MGRRSRQSACLRPPVRLSLEVPHPISSHGQKQVKEGQRPLMPQPARKGGVSLLGLGCPPARPCCTLALAGNTWLYAEMGLNTDLRPSCFRRNMCQRQHARYLCLQAAKPSIPLQHERGQALTQPTTPNKAV